MADWNLPATTTTYVDVLANLKDRDLDSAKLFDGVTVTNPATGMIRWSSANARLEKWNGTAWVPLAATHAINISGSSASTTGNAATATALQTARTINGVSFNGTANITVADATKLPLTGGTVTGTVTVNGAINGTAVTQSTTDTTAGRLLKVGDFGVGSSHPPLILDINNHDIKPGFYQYNINDGSTNGPEPYGTVIIVHAALNASNFGGWARQMFFGTLGVVYVRMNTAAGSASWGPWERVLTDQMSFNAATATALATARTINGIAFDGTANITIPTAPPVPGTLSGTAIDWGANAKWHATVSANTTFSFSSAPAVGTTCLLHVTHTSGTIAFPAAWVWPGNVAPSLTTGRVHIFAAYWDGAKYRASYLRNYPL